MKTQAELLQRLHAIQLLLKEGIDFLDTPGSYPEVLRALRALKVLIKDIEDEK